MCPCDWSSDVCSSDLAKTKGRRENSNPPQAWGAFFLWLLPTPSGAQKKGKRGEENSNPPPSLGSVLPFFCLPPPGRKRKAKGVRGGVREQKQGQKKGSLGKALPFAFDWAAGKGAGEL